MIVTSSLRHLNRTVCTGYNGYPAIRATRVRVTGERLRATRAGRRSPKVDFDLSSGAHRHLPSPDRHRPSPVPRVVLHRL